MGGTFDPIHNGHLRTALEIRQLLDLNEVRLIPCHIPVHREQPGSNAQQRLEMIRLAVEGEAGLSVDDREIQRSEPSYTINTLESLRQELGQQTSISMVMGMDSFLTLSSWHRWDEFLELAHILVVQRPGWEISLGHHLEDWCRRYSVQSPESIRSTPCGCLLMHRLTPVDISATRIRELIRTNQSPRYLIPDQVWKHIREQGLYR
ncbi:nicotinate-nicotinamide nucleotide adenylyltransferase [Motiliproteus sp. MSK22-1]|nr:nicotinate-nicotinamide nucleotide adenylyltransferase [Motiliproteus sp. MSK22-1]